MQALEWTFIGDDVEAVMWKNHRPTAWVQLTVALSSLTHDIILSWIDKMGSN